MLSHRDETTVLTFAGLGKLLRAHLPAFAALDGFDAKFDELATTAAKVLAAGRRGVAVAAAQLLTGVLQGYKHPHPGSYPWKRTLAAIDAAVAAVAAPGARAPLQARSELLAGLAAAYEAQRAHFDAEDVRALLKWLDAFARHPLGADDAPPVPGVLPPVQKAALAVLGQVAAGGGGAAAPPPAEAWPDVLRVLAGLLCPFRAAQQRKAAADAAAAEAAAAAAAASVAAGSASQGSLPVLGTASASASAAALGGPLAGPPGGLRPIVTAAAAAPGVHPVPSAPARLSSQGSLGPGRASLLSPRAPGSGRFVPAAAGGARAAAVGGAREAAAAVDARDLSPLAMARVARLLVPLYVDRAPWKVRAALFGRVAGALGECMALCHTSLCAAEAAAAADGGGGAAAGGASSGSSSAWPACDPVATFAVGDLWREAAAGFSAVVKAGLPAVNIVYVNHHQAPAEDTWPVLAAAFEAFLLGRGLPPALAAPASAPAARGGGARPHRRRRDSDSGGPASGRSSRRPTRESDSGGADGSSGSKRQRRDLRAVVLDTLTDNVLSACGSAPADAWQRLVGVVAECAAGAAPLAADEGDPEGEGGPGEGGSGAAAAATAPFAHLCLRQMAELCARGSGARGSDACLLGVARAALPPLLARCEALLAAVAGGSGDDAGGSAAAAVAAGAEVPGPGGAAGTAAMAPAASSPVQEAGAVTGATTGAVAAQAAAAAGEDDAVADALCALDVLLAMRLEPAVLEAAVATHPHIAPFVPPAHPNGGGGPGGIGGQAGWPQHGLAAAGGGGSGAFLRADSGAAGAMGGAGAGGGGGAGAPNMAVVHRTSSSGVPERCRTHLLALYGALVRCVGRCRDARVAAAVRAALAAAGEELGLVPPAPVAGGSVAASLAGGGGGGGGQQRMWP